MGWDDRSLNALVIPKISEDYCIKMITVFGRTKCQLYKGEAYRKFTNIVK